LSIDRGGIILKPEKKQKSELNRREFFSTITAVAGAMALGSAPDMASAAAKSSDRSGAKAPKRIGISDKAFEQAKKKARALVDRMTLDEKINQTGASSPPIERLNIPGYNYYTGEALHGLTRGAPVTSFPLPLALAAAWNTPLLLKIYTAISDEARAYDNKQKIGLSYYSPPTLNLHRDPRWGRCEEAPGEDPCLASTVGVQMVLGMQGDNPNYLKTTACTKHFICNNTDDDRTSISASVDPRSFWEYYTRAYRATVIDGDVFTAMGAYSALNGIPCCASRFLLSDLLRKRWGFRGYVTSDCDAIYNIFDPHHFAATQPIAASMAILAGCDLNCGGTLQQNLREAVNLELLSEDDISESITNIFTVRYLLGLFDPPEKVPYTKIPFSVVDSPAHRELALEAARQSLVLLKNENDFLPLDKSSLKKVAIIGPTAGLCHLGGYSGAPLVRISPYMGIAKAFGVDIHPNYISSGAMLSSGGGVQLEASSEGDTDLGFINNNSWAEYPKTDFSGRTEFQARVSSASQGGDVEVHLDKLDGPLACKFTVPATGGWQNWINVSTPLNGITGEHKIFLRFTGGQGYLLNVERFQLNPIPPSPAPKPGQIEVVFKPGCTVTGNKDETMFNDAVDAARDADVVIMVCGVNQEVDGEGHDRQTIDLTGVQSELIQAVYAVNPKIALVLATNNSVAINWEQEHIPAILCAVFAGQAQGTAIAEALFGEYNPGGKLPCTWYRSLDQLPDFHDYDISKGRTYMYFQGDPLYPFGHGLSYTTFQFSDLHIDSATLAPNEKVSVSMTISNTGKRPGSEVAQLYITAPAAGIKRPIKQLAGFQRVDLKPGQKKTVIFELPYSEQAFWYWDENKRKFVLQPGAAKILLGNSSANILLSGEINLQPASEEMGEPQTLNGIAIPSKIV
jgi:beta-glucosidase